MIASLTALAVVASWMPAIAEKQPTDANKPRTERVVCKSFQRTGSLVQRYKVCKPAKEWEKEQDQLRESNNFSDSCRDRGNGGALCQ